MFGGEQDSWSVRRFSDIRYEIETVAKTGGSVQISNRNCELLDVSRCTDEQNLTVDDLGLGLEIGGNQGDQIVRRFPIQRSAAKDGQHIRRHPILQNRKADLTMRRNDLFLNPNVLRNPRIRFCIL